MVKLMERVGRQEGLDGAQAKVGFDPYQVLIVASMVEREAKVDADRAKIARVIYNRLAMGMLLQIDATLLYKQNPNLSFAELKAIDTLYNTYLYEGLPPTPIANPGRASIRAALNPAPNGTIGWFFSRPADLQSVLTGLLAWKRGQPGQVGNEAAPTVATSAEGKARHPHFSTPSLIANFTGRRKRSILEIEPSWAITRQRVEQAQPVRPPNSVLPPPDRGCSRPKPCHSAEPPGACRPSAEAQARAKHRPTHWHSLLSSATGLGRRR